MNEVDLVRHFPRLWHMAEDGSFDSIRKHGLLSTSSLLDLYGVAGEARFALESQHRPKSVTISRVGLPDAVIRDQKPMTAGALKKCLMDGMSPEQWFKILNARVFFWLSRDRLRGLLGARAYRERPHTVLTVDTASLVNAHRGHIELSPINSGSTIYKPQPRGHDTFRSVKDYPFDERRKTRSVEKALVELVVGGSVPDIADHLVAAHRVNNGKQEDLWHRPGTAAHDGP